MIATASDDQDPRPPYNLVRDVTPEQACRWLEGNVHNRPVLSPHVTRLARDMKAGRWRLTHQGIAFDTDGILIDGQHRLWAVIEANVTVKMRVFYNEAPQNRHVLDSGQRRSNLDILRITGQGGNATPKQLAALRAMLAGGAKPARMTPGEEAEHFRRHRQAVEFATEHLPACPHKGVATAQIRAVIARAFYSADHGRLVHFCDVLRSGVPTDDGDRVILALRDYLIRTDAAGKGDSAQRLRYGKTEWVLSVLLSGETPKRLCHSTCELFPLPEESAAKDRPRAQAG